MLVYKYFDNNFHKEIYNKDYGNKNLLIYGHNGIGKKTFIRYLIKNKYNININHIIKSNFKLNGIIIFYGDNNINNNEFIEFLYKYISDINFFNNINIIIIYNFDFFSQKQQTIIKNILYSIHNNEKIRFIISVNYITKIIDQIVDYFYCIKLKSINKEFLKKYINKICINENIEINNNINNIINYSNNNIKTLLFLIEIVNINNIKYKNLYNDIKKINKNILFEELIYKNKKINNIINKNYENVLKNINSIDLPDNIKNIFTEMKKINLFNDKEIYIKSIINLLLKKDLNNLDNIFKLISDLIITGYSEYYILECILKELIIYNNKNFNKIIKKCLLLNISYIHLKNIIINIYYIIHYL